MLDIRKFAPPDYASYSDNNNSGLMQLLVQALMQQQGQQQAAQQQMYPQPEAGAQQQLGQGALMPNSNNAGLSWDELKKLATQTFPGDEKMQKIAMTQAVLESGGPGSWSGLAKQGNLFGIKDKNGMNMKTKEDYGDGLKSANANFATNSSPENSFMQYANLLNNPRYASVLSSSTPQDAFSALQNSGYATDSQYSQKLNDIYNSRIAPLFRSM